ncbi:MAG: M24 family metallopeptidase [Synergistaceae bacterium]|jgi:Xaa-Pro aminopeptidase|nr:M24 family metallopeptidase [Synergistaceae bacterium]
MKYAEDNSIAGRKAEISVKLDRVREMMEREGFKGVFLRRHNNFSWITAGAKSFVTLYVETGEASVLITKERQYALTNIIEQGRMRDEERLEELGFEIAYHPWDENRLAEMVKERAGDLGNIACDTHFENTRFANGIINPLHYSLLDNEVARYLHLGETLSAALEEYIVTVKPGMTEFEITGGLCKALWPKGIDQVLYLVAADERAYKYRHGIPTDKKLEKHLIISVNGRYKGLITTVTRMIHFGGRDEKIAAAFDAACEVECRSVAVIKPGSDDVAAYRACKAAYEATGHPDMWSLHGQGGAQSYNNRDYMITENSHRITAENQGYCYNPVIDGTKAEDAFIATSEGPVFITKPVTFPVVEKEYGNIRFRLPGIVFAD